MKPDIFFGWYRTNTKYQYRISTALITSLFLVCVIWCKRMKEVSGCFLKGKVPNLSDVIFQDIIVPENKLTWWSVIMWVRLACRNEYERSFQWVSLNSRFLRFSLAHDTYLLRNKICCHSTHSSCCPFKERMCDPTRNVHRDDQRAPPHPPGSALWNLPLHGGHIPDGHPVVWTYDPHGHASEASPRPHLLHQGNKEPNQCQRTFSCSSHLEYNLLRL